MGVVHWYFIRDFQNLPHPRPTHTPPSLLIIKLCDDAFTNQQDKDYFIMPCYIVSNNLRPPPKKILLEVTPFVNDIVGGG